MEILETGVDPRDSLISANLDRIKRVIIFASGKGGVGKSTISAHTAYIMSERYKTGILDLDLHGPSIPFILGLRDYNVKEGEKGILPAQVDGIKVMSLELFMKGKGSPLRGNNKYEIIKELIAITDFGDLDYLLVDMPPGTGDEFLAVLEIFRKNGQIIFITAPSMVSWQVTKRAIEIARGKLIARGVIINMGRNESIVEECKVMRIRCIGSIDYYPYIVDRNVGELKDTDYFRSLRELFQPLITH
ncbi:MAG: P-loop NTPase [Thermoplasmata archaeon]|jgi:ATP-binding protein involved in chromosome partitioning